MRSGEHPGPRDFSYEYLDGRDGSCSGRGTSAQERSQLNGPQFVKAWQEIPGDVAKDSGGKVSGP